MCTLGLKPSRRFTISSDEHGPSNHVCAAASDSTHSANTNMFVLSLCVHHRRTQFEREIDGKKKKKKETQSWPTFSIHTQASRLVKQWLAQNKTS